MTVPLLSVQFVIYNGWLDAKLIIEGFVIYQVWLDAKTHN